MPEPEIVDIIDANNQVIGQIDKNEAHKTGTLHRCIVTEVIDSQGNWLLVKQASDRQDAGQYVSPVGGHIRTGEAEEVALARETLEEIGLTSYTIRRVGQAIFNREVIGRKENHLLIVYEIYCDQAPVLNHESVGYEKIPFAEIQKQIVANPQKFGEAFHFVYNHFYIQK